MIKNVPSSFFVAGIIFLFGVMVAFLLLYSLLGTAYAQMKEKNHELEAIKKETERQKKDE